MSKEKGPKERGAISQLLDFAEDRKALVFVGCALSALSQLLGFVPFICIWLVARDLIAVAPNWAAATNIAVYGWAALGFAVLSIAVYFAALMCTHMAAFRTQSNMRKRTSAHLMHVPLGYFDTHASGALRRVMDGCAANTEQLIAHMLPDACGSVAMVLGTLVILFVFDWRLGLACLAPIVVSFLCLAKMMTAEGMQFMQRYQEALVRMNKTGTEYVRGIPVVKVFQQTVYSFKAFHDAIQDYSQMAMDYSVKGCQKPQVMNLSVLNGLVVFLVPVAILLAPGEGDLAGFAVNFAFYAVFSALIPTAMTKVMFMGQAFQTAEDAFSRVKELLSAPVLEEPENPKVPADASIEFDHVSFAYESNDSAPAEPEGDAPSCHPERAEGESKDLAPGNVSSQVDPSPTSSLRSASAQDDVADAEAPTPPLALDDVTFAVPVGSTVALVGPSGGGKSTAASLVPRFWDASAGTVRIGGVDVREINSHELMSKVAFVFQTNQLFSDTLFENVRAARPDATREQVSAALEAAQCQDIVDKLPSGVDTVLGPGGAYLSGGEVQRVALARAILKDAPIVVLDEATAFADPENEALIQKGFARLAAGRTVLMIAHRLSTVVGADKIVVLDQGHVAEQGTHAELLAAGGLYSRMWADYEQAVQWRIDGNGSEADAVTALDDVSSRHPERSAEGAKSKDLNPTVETSTNEGSVA